MNGWRKEEDEMLKCRRKARIALVVEFRVSFWMWCCVGCWDDGDLVKEVEMEGDCRKLKIYTKLDLTINEALLPHRSRRSKEKELDLMPILS